MAGDPHPVLITLTEAALGRPPLADGAIEVHAPPPGPTQAVLAFTAYHVIAADIDADVVHARLDPSDLGAPMSADFLLFLSGWLGRKAGVLDVLLAATAVPSEQRDGDAHADGLPLWPREDIAGHPRVERASRYRPATTVYADTPDGPFGGLLVIGQGFAGRWEMAYEVEPDHRGRGLGRRLARASRRFVPEGAPVFAQVSPGNAASLRSCLAAGFTPIGSEVLFAPYPRP